MLCNLSSLLSPTLFDIGALGAPLEPTTSLIFHPFSWGDLLFWEIFPNCIIQPFSCISWFHFWNLFPNLSTYPARLNILARRENTSLSNYYNFQFNQMIKVQKKYTDYILLYFLCLNNFHLYLKYQAHFWISQENSGACSFSLCAFICTFTMVQMITFQLIIQNVRDICFHLLLWPYSESVSPYYASHCLSLSLNLTCPKPDSSSWHHRYACHNRIKPDEIHGIFNGYKSICANNKIFYFL